MVLILSGKRLNILASLTPLLLSDGAHVRTVFGTISLPLLSPPDVNGTSYPETSPLLIFQRKITMYLSRLLSCERKGGLPSICPSS
jgi:hypothetical protein